MRKWAFILIFTLVSVNSLFARHIKGGEISYEYLGPGVTANTDKYRITLRLFLECNASGQQLDPSANIGIYDNASELLLGGRAFEFPLTGDIFINLTTPNPCINSPSPVCYRLRTYTSVVELPRNGKGYTCVFQRCCRIDGLSNLSPNRNIGSSYTCKIHGLDDIGPNDVNSSPSFAVKDTVLICQNRPFTLDFSANDPDDDSLSYVFSDAYSASQGGGGVLDPVPPSSLYFVSYAPGFTGSTPLGSKVSIDPATGIISGIAPIGGDYVLSVTVTEWRHGKPISEHRKDFNIRIDNQCDLAAAQLAPAYQSCDDFIFTFENESPPSTLIHSYSWDFGVAGTNTDVSAAMRPTFTFPDTGVYAIKLVINRGEQCSDSATSIINVFPDFKAGFRVVGSCQQNPFQFIDSTRATYGTVNKWSWNFGDETTAGDTASQKNPSWKYSSLGFKSATLIVSSSKGCIDTVKSTFEVRDKPAIDFTFRDTLICSIDTLQLHALGNGQFTWASKPSLLNANTPDPLVYPKQTSWYPVTLNENGCINTDSVKVRVIDYVTLDAGPDTTICLNDSLVLRPSTDGLYFQWSPAGTLNNASIRNPVAVPTGNTTYTLIASVGKCSSADQVKVMTIPYPQSFAGADTTICFEDTAHLHGRIIGSRFTWSPVNTLSSGNTLSPLAFPTSSTQYQLLAYDTLGCPKPGQSIVMVNVLPEIFAFAGNDTAVVVDQPLQLHGTGAELVQWRPSTYLDNPESANPVALLNDNFIYILKAYTPEGCFDLDTINIRVFKTRPDIFVPNAFVPSGANRILRPIPVGIQDFDYFRVYNRWGQLVFESREASSGWDGSIHGLPQPAGTYVWMVRGRDFLGNVIAKKGTAVLIR